MLNKLGESLETNQYQYIMFNIASGVGMRLNMRGSMLVGALVAVGILSVVAAGTMQLISNLSQETRVVRQSAEAQELQRAVSQLLASEAVCTRNFGATSSSAVAINGASLNRNLVDAAGTTIYRIDGTTPYQEGTLAILSYQLQHLSVLQATAPATVTGKLILNFKRLGVSMGTGEMAPRSINFTATLAGGVGSPIQRCSALGLDDALWRRLADNIYNTNPGFVGIGMTNPVYSLDVAGNMHAAIGDSSFSFNQEGTASVMRLKSTRANEVVALLLGNASNDYQLRVNSDNSLALGYYLASAPGQFRGFSIKNSATVNGSPFSGTIFEFGVSGNSGTPQARIVGSPTGSVFQGFGTGPTLIGNWDGGHVHLYSANNLNVTAGNTLSIGSSGGGVVVLAQDAVELNSSMSRVSVLARDNVSIASAQGEISLSAAGALRLNSGSGQIIGSASYQSSDESLKQDIEPLQGALDKVLSLRGVAFNWKDAKLRQESGKQIGLIAQEVQKQFPQAVTRDKKTGLLAVAYDHLVAPLIEAVKALNAKNESAVLEIARLKTANAELEKRLSVLEKKLAEKK